MRSSPASGISPCACMPRLEAAAMVAVVEKRAKAAGKGGKFKVWQQKAVLSVEEEGDEEEQEEEEEEEACFSEGGARRRLRARRR